MAQNAEMLIIKKKKVGQVSMFEWREGKKTETAISRTTCVINEEMWSTSTAHHM